MPRQEVSEHWKSIILLSKPISIELNRCIGYDYNLKITYIKKLCHEYKYNLNNDMTINRDSIDLFINGKYIKSINVLSSNEREEKLLSNFITFIYTCHNDICECYNNYNVFTYNTYKLLRKFVCNIL